MGGSKNLKLLPLIIAGAAIVAVVALERLLATPSATSPALLQFVGRFHPLAVHLPIGVLLFVAFAEGLCLVPSLRPKIEPVLPFLLPFLLVAAVGSFVLGLFLAHGGGYPQRLVRLHRLFTLGGVIGAAILFALYLSRELLGAALARGLYRGTLLLTLGAISYGAHHGGSMTRGEGYLFQYAPAFVQRLAGYEPKKTTGGATEGDAKPAGEDAKVFADVVVPVLRRTCFECHGEATQKGSLRLDSLEAILKGGDGGPAIVAGNATKSSIVARMILPAGNDERMPPENKPAPTPEEIALVRFWIDRGANDTLRVRDALAPDDARKVLEASLTASPTSDPKVAPTSDPEPPSTATPADTAPTPDATTSGGATPASTSGGSGGGTVETPASDDASAYARHVAPILEARCVSCHGAAKQKGKLRLDSFDAMFTGGKAGPAVIAKSASTSPLVARLKLPLDHEEHMPPPKEPQLDENQVALIAWWVDAGASKETPATAVPAKLRGASKPPGDTPPTTTGTPPTATGTPPTATGTPTTTPPTDTPPVAGNDPTGKPPPGQVYVYRDVVTKVVGKKCGACHASPGPSGGLDVMTYQGLLASSVVPGKPEESSLLQRALLPIDHDDHMPPPALPQPTQAELEIVRAWIQDGAKRDALVAFASIPAEVATALELPPPEATTDAPPLPSASAPRPTNDDGPAPLQGGGCAACTVGEGIAGGASALAFTAAVAVAWTLRRRRRTR